MSSKSDFGKDRRRPIVLNGARKGEIAKALTQSIEKAREANTLRDDPLMIAIATRTATLADAAWRANQERVALSAYSKLAGLAKALGLHLGEVPAVPAEGGSPDDDLDEAGGGGDVIDRELAAILGAGPTVRDESDG